MEHNFLNSDFWNLIIQGFVAIGTVAVAVLAIWGNFFKYKIAAPKLSIVPSNLRGTVTSFTNGSRVIYYHLKVVNSRPWSTAHNCQVILKSIAKRLPNGTFNNVPLPVCPSFVWAPAQITPPLIDLSTEQTFDFVNLVQGDTKVNPVLTFYPNNFDGFIRQNECFRFSLEINAEGFKSSKLSVFEVAWNGQWTDNLDNMSNNLTIREIK